jgi:thioredoxin-like negative regulator of GroEL
VRAVRQSQVVKLSARDFATQVQGKSGSPGLWVVDVSAGAWCGPCTMLKPAVRRVATELDGVAKVGTCFWYLISLPSCRDPV